MLTPNNKSVVTIFILLAALALAACQAETRETDTDGTLPSPVVKVMDDAAQAVNPSSGNDIAAETGQNGQDAQPSPAGLVTVGNGPGVANHSQLADSAAELSQEEIDALMYMREEEKVARDIYLFLFEQWGQPVFQNIAASEQAHMDSVLGLMDLYGLTDPAASEAGVFTNSELQTLYDQLVDQGSMSAADALKVGALIEEVDILDLEIRLADSTNAQIVQVFNNLLRGSANHLRAFVTNLERLTGEIYEPQVMSLEEYQAIMSGSIQPGGNGNGYGGGANASGGNTGNGGAYGSGGANGGAGATGRGGRGNGQGQAAG